MKEIPEITGMRGYASLGVVFFHFTTLGLSLAAIPFALIVTAWNTGVDFFFVLSGFLLSIPFLQPGSPVSLKRFYVKRIFRILPVYYLNLIIIGTILILSSRASLYQLFVSLFFAQSFSPATFNSINGVNWTLVIEEIFYATLPLFAFFFTGKRWHYSLPVCFAISILYREWVILHYAQSDITFHLWQYPTYLGHYALGITLANFYVRGKFFAGKIGSSLPLIGAVALLIITQYYIGITYGISNNVKALPDILFALEYGILIFSTLSIPANSIFRFIFNNRFASFFGKISYSLYTWHLPVEIMLLKLKLPQSEWVGLSLLFSLSIAILSYRFVEKPFLKLRNRLLGEKVTAKEKSAPLMI